MENRPHKVRIFVFAPVEDLLRNSVVHVNTGKASLQQIIKNVTLAIAVNYTENLETLDNNMEARPHKVRIFVSAPVEDPPRNSAVFVNKGKASVQQIFTTALGMDLTRKSETQAIYTKDRSQKGKNIEFAQAEIFEALFNTKVNRSQQIKLLAINSQGNRLSVTPLSLIHI